MGVARFACAPRPCRALYLFVIASSLLFVPNFAQFSDQIVFNSDPTYHVPEEQPVGTAIVILEAYYVLATPFQLRADGVFSLGQLQNDSQFFTIESALSEDGSQTEGTIRNTVLLDRDGENAQTVFTLSVTYSTPDGSLNTTNILTIILSDINDNAPQFSQTIYTTSVLEAASPGTMVIQLTATDIDDVQTQQLVEENEEDFGDLVYIVDNGRIFYSIVEGNDMGEFDIDYEGGAIFVTPDAMFDVDTQDRYNITVVAMDAPGLNTTASVVINILDSNDNPPQILTPGDLNLTLSEDTPTGLVIVESINATDGDRGLNAEIQFLILSGDITNSFTIDASSGRITLTAPLDREGGDTSDGVITLVVAAQDQGIPPLEDTITVVIAIEDVNDFAPLFQEVIYEASVREGARSGFRVIQVIAVDGDEGPGGVVSYSIISGGNENFYIDSQTGEIFTNTTFDREERAFYQLVVEARDNLLNTTFQLSSVVNVTIAIEDLNDNPPIFNETYYTRDILDNVTRGTNIIMITATDDDEGVNARITYEFTDPLPSNSERFRINNETGLVEVNQRPRYDIETSYDYTIRALDGVQSAYAFLTIFIHDVDETPPIFEQDEYNVTLSERTPIGTSVLQVMATDEDGPGPIGRVMYQIITEFDEAGSFSVENDTGIIRVHSRLDYDTRNYTFFQVEAYDGGYPVPFTDVTNVTVFLEGENDEAPSIIFPDGFFPTVPENEPPGYDIVYLFNFTFDPDIGLGGEFNLSLYEIYDPLSEGSNESFSLNTTTGLLRGLRTFNREDQPDGIEVAIETSDYGMPPESKIMNITVMIGDKNDRTPFFPSNLSIDAYEFLPPGFQIFDEFHAIDEDIGVNAELTYEIFEGDPLNQFSIDSSTGRLFTTDILNKTNQTFYNLTITVCDGGSPQLHAFGQIEVEVIDLNDNAPIFTMETYIVNLTENATLDTVVLQVNATDMDEGTNAHVQYFLTGTTNYSQTVNERFAMDPTTGELTTRAMFDREQDASFVLEVVAIDNGTVPMRLTGSATIQVVLIDVNDHTPIFNNDTYTGEVIENSPNGTFVTFVTASDGDAEKPNNDIIFSLNGSRSDVLQIDPTSGNVTVAMEIDWEEGAVISIIVIATDGGNPPLSSTAEMFIFIEDVNDRPPIFTQESLNLEISENVDPPAPVTPTIIALDPDSQGNNSLVTYQVIDDLTQRRFELNPESGEVTFVRGELNRERRATYEMVIRAIDHGTPRMYTDANITIHVLDANDFDPMFNQEHFYGSIPENAPLGTTVLTLAATDMDVGSNGELSFFLLEISDYIIGSGNDIIVSGDDIIVSGDDIIGSGDDIIGSGDDIIGSGVDDEEYFIVNETSGDIITGSDKFDFELPTIYSLVVMVTDHGIPSGNHTSLVTVTITDFNDNAPVFSEAAYSKEIYENLSPYTTVLRVSSTDADSGFNRDIRYSLAAGDGTQYFDIDSVTGVLYTIHFINREITPYFNITIIANNSLSSHPLWSNITANITILDLSDTHPSFDVVTHVNVEEDAPVGSIVFNLSATDGDEGLAGSVRYDIIHGNHDNMFILNSTTGSVTLASSLDYESISFYEFVVMATDMATPTSLMNYTNVLVHVIDSNDNPPRFVSTNYTLTLHHLINVNTLILELVAVDSDSGTNSDMEYEIEGGSDFFNLQSDPQPSLFVSNSLEHQSGTIIPLLVTVRNPGTDPVLGWANVTIQVISTLPLFYEIPPPASVTENQLPPATIIELSPYSNGIDYSIVSGNEEGIFTVDNVGTLSLDPAAEAMLDYETQSIYQLTVSVEDSAGNKNYNVLTISLSDVNDITPEFITSSFLVHIPETTPVGVPIFIAMATDKDGSFPANYVEIDFFGSVSEAITNTFSVDSSTGEISLLRELDYENGDENFTFVISASNEGSLIVTTANVSIVVVNGNNHDPVFVSPIFDTIVLYENESVGISIFNASAVDGDYGSAREITYGLRGEDHRYLDFDIDTFTGEIVLNSELDRERTREYQLVIVAADRGNPGRTATSLLVVGVQDINDNIPQWEQLEYSVTIHENTSVGTVITVVKATDIDQVDANEQDGEIIYFQTNGLVHYNITDGDPGGQFFIEPFTGSVKIASPLDRETIVEYELTITASDGGGRAANATLYVTVVDVNDFKPRFSQEEYIVSIPEHSENGTFVVNVSAVDSDLAEGALFVYDIDTGDINDDDDIFAINSSTGMIWVNLPVLDRESIPIFNLTVLAIDFGDPSLTGSTQVIVHLLDLNEFPPVFDEVAYNGTIAENASLTMTVISVNTTDLDYGENATAIFTLVSNGNNDTQNVFDINPLSGVIFVSGLLDFEEINQYQFVVMATDSGPIRTRLSTEVNVTIMITDINDNVPVFDNFSYTAVVCEDTLPLTPLIIIQATDIDSGVNAEILYSLDPPEDNEYFILDRLTGVLSLASDARLDHETQIVYQFIAIATDSGDPQLNSTVPVTIVIEDVNDNVPTFTIESPYNSSVMENLPPGQAVASVIAEDADSAENGEITYSIEREIENENDCNVTCINISDDMCMSLTNITQQQPLPSFTIDNMTGLISTVLPLDREQQTSHLLLIQAIDSGNETRLSSLTCLLVTVLDDNDEVPTFPVDGYNATISESTTEGVFVIQVTAVDEDTGYNAAVTYHIVESETSRFTVHPTTGDIYTLGGYDRESRDQYDVIVLAIDGGNPPLNSSTVVTVTITDENDNAPLFNQSEYFITFPENKPPFSSIYLLQAFDEDAGSNAEITYVISSASPQNHFLINTTSGLLQSTVQLDREEITSYLVTIISTDMGNPPMTSSTTINITIEDANDNVPVFSENEYFVSVVENIISESPILYVSATDVDIGSNSLVRYNILNGTTPYVDSFAIDSLSGAVYLVSSLDAEESLSYTVTVVAINDGAVPELASVMNITVAVGDVNDHAPVFSQTEYVVVVLETVKVGSEVIQLNATDADATETNTELHFEISGGHNMSLFSIDAHTGSIFIAAPLDREREPSHVIQVTVFDNGTEPGQLKADVNVTFVLQDFNDNEPIFDQTSYSFSVHENNNSSILIGRVHANDIDLQSVYYSITEATMVSGSGSGSGLEISEIEDYFAINTESGEIYTSISFNREERDVYTFYAVATDNGTLVQLSSQVLVTIAILDVNDVAPIFSLPNYTTSWPEDVTPGSILLTVMATDPDLDQGGVVGYSLLPSNDSGVFSINSSSGAIDVVGMFDREQQDTYIIEVIARDYGTPTSLTSSVVVIVTILDVNDNNPILNASEYNAIFPEDTPLNSTLISVAASDTDIGSNSEISFSISSDFNSTFILDRQSGIISLNHQFDYEHVHNYTFFVVATDNGNPRLSTSAEVLISVIDLNDNPPVFTAEIYYTSIPENAIIDTSIFDIPATDADSTSNSELQYSILGGNVEGVFEIDEVSGIISLHDYLDREIIDFYSLSLRVVDMGIPQFTATAQLTVQVMDVNDHVPRFDSDVYFVSVPEQSGIGTVVGSVSATDEDVGVNANLTYHIIAGDPEENFMIAPQTGEVSIRRDLDYESIPSHSLTILVSDHGQPESHTDTVIFTISILDQNEYQPFYLESNYIIDIPDNTPPGTRLGTFPAADRDVYLLPSLRYTLSNHSNTSDIFTIDQYTAHLYTLTHLPTNQVFNISITANDGVFTATIDITIIVFSFLSSSLPPVFQSPSFIFSADEDTTVGERVASLGVTNSDDVIFILVNDSLTDFPFEVTSAGYINLIGRLDYETTPNYLFSVQAISTLNSSLVSQTVVTMVIDDANDNPPTFEISHYQLIISELTPVSSHLVTLTAHDLDTLGVNREVQFSITGGNNDTKFNLDPSTGDLTLVNLLDYEQEPLITLNVSVVNYLAVNPLSSEAVVSIVLRDENDHSPQFTEPYYQTEISSSAPVGTNVITLSADDRDSGENAELSYLLTHLDIPLSFIIDHDTGVVSVGLGFRGDINTYVLGASVSDRGAPQPRSDTTTIFITVVPHNAYPPQFSQPGGYNVTIDETLSLGGSVVQIFASDLDPTDSLITFSITSGDPEEIFTMDPSTGIIYLSGVLDYQMQSSYQLEVTAEDNGTPSRNSTVVVNISIKDINNHAPIFDESQYTISILENTSIGSSVAMITASDPDTINITYILTVNSYDEDGIALFSLSSDCGTLTTTSSLDREVTDVHELLISAVDSGYPVRLSNSVPVTVGLLDLNDTPPQFDQSDYIFPLLRYLASNLYVATVTATDSDLIGQQLVYDIVNDTSEGLFAIDSTTGVISTRHRVPEDALVDYSLILTAFDGHITTTVLVTMILTSEGQYCEESGLCTSVSPVNCSFISFGTCDPRLLGALYDPFCTDEDYILSPDQYLCVKYSCFNSSHSLCLSSDACLPPNVACDGHCPAGTALCPTTQLCHVTSLRQSCDETNSTCLIGQILVETADTTRECHPLTTLPSNAQNCTVGGQLYCIQTSECANITIPTTCPTCPSGQTLCSDTRRCVPSPDHCCGEEGYFCDVLNVCLMDGDTCALPNIPPVVFTTLIHVDSTSNFEPESGDGHVISELLSNSSNNITVDSQGEELSIAITETSTMLESDGEWQYGVCISSDDVNECEWLSVGTVSEDNALLLPSIARIRFVRRSVTLEGAVWMKAKLWDGNEDGYLSPTLNAVRYSQYFYHTTLPYSTTGAFSENSTLFTVLLLPIVPPPTLPSTASFTLTPLTEDTPITGNHGNTIKELVEQVLVPELPVLPVDEINGFPDDFLFTEFKSLQSSAASHYLDRVNEVNPARLQRQSVMERGLAPGIGIRLSIEDETVGRWQVAWNGDIRKFVYITSLLSLTNQILLLDTTARLRFIPIPNYCGQVSIPFHPWDGYWNESMTNQTDNEFLVTMDTALSEHNLNDELSFQLTVECTPDKPVLLVNRVKLEPVPYYISYNYQRLFTVIVSMETNILRGDRDRLSELLHITLEREVDILRIAGYSEMSSQVSFSLQGEEVGLTLSELQTLLQEKADILLALGFPITNISQNAYYGPGESCSSHLTPQPIPGVTIASLTNQIAVDSDGETLGVAIVSSDSASDDGVWQYLRGNWSNLHQTAYNNLSDIWTAPHEGLWINFPRGLDESHTLLLHPLDRIRYVPRPNHYWTNDHLPYLSLKAWDVSLGKSLIISGNEAFLSGINTDPYVDTTQSLFRTIGIFSDDVTILEASRHGCDDVTDSGLTFDPCCVCGGDGMTCTGCDGVVGSETVYDGCGQCGGDGGGCVGCDMVPFSYSETGTCGECVSVVSVSGDSVELVQEEVRWGVVDCEGVCWGRSVSDECGKCVAEDSTHQYNIDMDCTGVCAGNATIDDCGYCTGPGTILSYNWNLDCTGVCGGAFRSDSCNICQLPDERGDIIEHRDCLGVCYGEAIIDECQECHQSATSKLVGSSLDICGVCGGQNSTCVGCDGSPASGVNIDSCGVCGGNDCGCFKIDFIATQWGPKSGGTEVIIHGAGFFLNDSSIIDFNFDPQSENCGAPREISGGESVLVNCQFASGENNAITADDVIIINQSTIRCITKATTADLIFDLTVSIQNGPRSNPVVFRYYDDDLVTISNITPVDIEIGQNVSVSFHGNNFDDTGSSVCLMYGSDRCGIGSINEVDPVVIRANYISENEVNCILPAAIIPCEVTLQLSQDGQRSGVVTPGDITFTYRYSAPVVNLIYFSDDLSSLIIQFDRSVELIDSSSISSTLLSCSDVFSLTTISLLGQLVSCTWLNTRQDTIVVHLSPSSQVTVNSTISFRSGTMATKGQIYSYTISDMESFPVVESGLSSISPVAVIDGPHSIPTCGNFSYTGINSYNPGYGGMSYHWSILTVDSMISQYQSLLDYLDSLDDDTETILLSSSWFVSDVQYYLELVVINSVGVESAPDIISLMMTEEEDVPQVFITGLDEREIRESESVILEAVVFTPTCSISHQLSFNWQLYKLTDERRGSLSVIDLSSLPVTTPLLYLPPFFLDPSSQYTISLSMNQINLPHVEVVNITVYVAATELEAVIHGGHRTVSVNRTVVLDARSSVYDRDSLTTPIFSWSCNVIGSGEPCYNHSEAKPTPIIIPKSDVVYIPGSELVRGFSYNFTLELSHSSSIKSSYSSVTISITDSMAPIVEIITGAHDELYSHEVVVRGLVYSTTQLDSIMWESLSILSQGYVEDISLYFTPITYFSSSLPISHSFPINLVLPANTLPPHLTHTFQLTATNEAGTSFSQISISTNPSPHSANITITPAYGGTSLKTVFSISVTGALDSVDDIPLQYQFGISFSTDEGIQWLTCRQVEQTLSTILPSGVPQDYNLTIVVRVFDRSGGFSDIITDVIVEPTPIINNGIIRSILSSIDDDYRTSRDWQQLLTNLVSVAMEIDSTPSLSESLKRDSLNIFLDVFSSSLPASRTHYELAAQLLSRLVTTNDNTNIDELTIALTTIGSWFRGQSSIEPVSILPVVNGNQDDPLQLLAVEDIAPSSSALTLDTAAHLITTWSTIADTITDDIIITSFLKAIEDIGFTLCQGMVYGEAPSLVTSSLIELEIIKAPPTGWFSIGEDMIELGTSLKDIYYDRLCPWEQQTCFETCFLGARYSIDLFSSDNHLKLTTAAEERVIAEIEGSDPLAIELISDIVSVTVPVPSQNEFLDVDDLEQEIVILLKLQQSVQLVNGSITLCLYRELGGSHGFTGRQWKLDSTSSLSYVVVDSVIYYQCRFTHLTEFAIGLLPPPIIPPPLSPTPIPSPVPSSKPLPSYSPIISLSPPTAQPKTSISPAVIAIPIILVIIIVAIVCVVVFVILWWKKKVRSVKIMPVEDSSGVDAPDGKVTSRFHSGPLTPEESKVPMPIIELLKSGKREVVGSMNVLPSIRLRELRYHLLDQFASFKSKPFYFLTRQLVDIEPPTEQQQFVSLVYGEEADKPIFIRRVETTSDLTRLHFCVCGNAAQFECSSCSAQGYCSPECQTSDWTDRHQRVCGRLGEKKQRMSVLRRQSTVLSPVDEQNRLPSIFPERQNISAATPLDFRSLLNSQRSFQRMSFSTPQSLEPSMATPSITSPNTTPTSRPSLLPVITPRSSRTTIGMLAAQSSRPPTIMEENEREDVDKVNVHPMSPTTPHYRPPVGRYGRTRLAPLLSTPAKTTLTSFPPPHSTPVTSPHTDSSPTSQFFHRPDPKLRPLKEQLIATTANVKKLSIQSLGPVDYTAVSPIPQLPASRESVDIRTPPHLESGSDSSSESDDGRPSSTLQTSRPPSLSVHSKKSAAAPPSPSSSSITSGSSSGSEDSDSSSDTQPTTPLVTEQN